MRLLIAILTGIMLLDTPTPTPDPTATPTSPGNPSAPISVFAVDNQVPLPWPLPTLPTYAPTQPAPTLYAATAPHSTSYPAQAGTATIQVGEFSQPIHDIQTPAAAFMDIAPTADGTDLDSGLDPIGEGNVTFSDFGTALGEGIGTLVGVTKAIGQGFLNMADEFPLILPIVIIFFAAMVIGAILRGAGTVIKVGIGLMNLLQKILVVVGEFLPG